MPLCKCHCADQPSSPSFCGRGNQCGLAVLLNKAAKVCQSFLTHSKEGLKKHAFRVLHAAWSIKTQSFLGGQHTSMHRQLWWLTIMYVGCRDGTVCGWREPPLRHFVGEPVCSVEANGTYPNDGATLSGALYRVTTCELQYGPMNCDFIWGATNEYVLRCPIWPLLSVVQVYKRLRVEAEGLQMP